MKKLLALFLLIPVLSFAQQGVLFEHDLTWKQIQAKAKSENKYIFLDAYTTWCGPCRYMSEKIFPQDKVGTYFNKNFINVKVQLDTTAKDNDYVKSWYADGHTIMNNYKINAFPTYLFFDPNGKVVHRIVGGSEAEVFISKSSEAFNPEKQYYAVMEKFHAGNKDPDFLRKAAMTALEGYDTENAKTISNLYLSTQKDLLTKENIAFLDQFTISSKDTGFAIIKNNASRYDAVKGAGAADRKLIEIIKADEFFPAVFRINNPKPDWTALENTINTKYPNYGKEVVSGGKVMYYQRKGDWSNFQSSVLAYMKDYSKNVSVNELNEFAWTVFENCKDMSCVKEALEWSRQSFKDMENPLFIDTYANILYKLGNKAEAIKWEEKALALSNNEKTYQDVLDKMRKGEKTWKD